jgi:GNAT superfamily N-acetyltransferase
MPTSAIRTRRATLDDLEALTPLFDAYRQFYRFEADLPGARQFLEERLRGEDSAIFLALQGEHLVGFTQLYPSFSSGAMARIFVLNDLFVTPEVRRQGIGFSLLAAAAEYARAEGAVRLALSTELTNTAAQAAYEKAGWKRDIVFCVYQLALR